MPRTEHRTIDFFAEDALPAPRTTPAEAEHIAAQNLGIAAHADSLGSQQDANFALRDGAGSVLAVLKIANPAFGPVEVEAQDAAADLVVFGPRTSGVGAPGHTGTPATGGSASGRSHGLTTLPCTSVE
ncbi:hypothetical protein ABZ372_45340 [Streptomyces sp. NPDC005921]